MNKDDLKDICTLRDSVCTAPPLEWLAIHKKNGKSVRVQTIDLDRRRVFIEESGYWNFSDCHICAFTGYTDSESEKVYDRQLVKFFDKIYYIVWRDFQWCIENDTSTIPLCECDPSEMTIIGHIHTSKLGADGIKPWPEEVRRLLE